MHKYNYWLVDSENENKKSTETIEGSVEKGR